MSTRYRLTAAQRLMFFAVLSAIFLAALDQTVVATALPMIALDLHGLPHLPWVVTGYLLTSTVCLPLYGKLGDQVGRKRILLIAISLFLLGSMLCGLAWNMNSLILFRSLQGLGGGGILVTAIASISDFIPLEQRGKYQGLVGATFGLATLVGPFLGGLVVETVGWRWIFYLNVPFGLFSLGVVRSAFPRRAHAAPAFDYAGAIALVLGLTALVLLAERALRMFLQAALLVTLLGSLWVLLRVSPRHPDPLLPIRFFRHRTFSASVLVSLFVGAAMLGSISFLPTYYQEVRGLTPTVSGLEMLYLLVGMLATSVLIGRWISRYQRFRHFPLIGTLLTALALGRLSQMGVTTPFWQIDVALVLLGIGLGSTMQVMVLSAQWALPHRHLGVATSTVSLFRSMGGTLGVAGFGAVFSRFVGNAVAAGQSPQDKIVAALHWDFAVAAGLTLIAFLAAWGLEDLPVLMARRKTGPDHENSRGPGSTFNDT